jgi:diguanylate cyclase (GGDEF)-like protein
VLAANPAGSRVAEAALRDLRAAGDSVVPYDAADGIPVLARIAEVPASDWGVVAEIPAASAFAQISELRTATIVTVLVLLLVVGAFAYGLGLLIVLPLERLSGAAQRVAGGDLDVDVPVTGSGEVSQLGRVFNDMVRRLREGRAELERLSVTDALTGLANRRRLTTELEREVHRGERHGRPFAVLMLDVDRFKVFNDTFGHPAGDAVLKRLARVLQENARDVDTVARYGGEEFTMILAETDGTTAAGIAERVRGAVEADRFVPEGRDEELNITVSIGIALCPLNGRTPDALVTAADAALYQSKSAGRNRVTAASAVTSEPPKPRKRKGS